MNQKKNRTPSGQRYLRLLNLDEGTVWKEVPLLASELTGNHHIVRSAIIDLHFSVELEIRKFLYYYLCGLLIYKNKQERDEKRSKLTKQLDSWSFGQIWKVVQIAIRGGPWPDLEQIEELNKTRNQVAHGTSIERVRYRDRNPFTNPDCFANMYFDVWAISQTMPKLFHKIIEESIINRQYYKQGYEAYNAKYGDLDFEFAYQGPFED